MDRDLFLTPGADMPVAQRPLLYIVNVKKKSTWIFGFIKAIHSLEQCTTTAT